MGGDALPFPTQRLSPARYHDVSTRLLTLLSTHYTHACTPPPRPNKPSHGDVDILVAGPLPARPFDPAAQLQSRAVVRNGGVTSFECEGHQADVICVGVGQWGSARLFYSYGDVGMVVGMMVGRVGLKFGYGGLSFVRHHTQLHLSSDRTRILAWLGMSEAAWLAGFTDERAVSEWLCSCRWFRPSMFARDNDSSRWNGGERRALSNRTMFTNFITHVHNTATASPAAGSERLSVEAVQADAIAFFGCEAAVAALDAAVVKRAALKRVWNGVVVGGRTGLVGKQLGLFMMMCRGLVTDDELLEMDVAEVERFIDECFAKHVRDNIGGDGNESAKVSEESKESEQTAGGGQLLVT